ncbi:MAG: TatD family hydrolase [Methyloceanibacter sp.]|nr:MAG: TatD family hydrolase [Methyloceanibacter sp.]
MIDFHCHLDLYSEPYAVTRACVERSIYVLSVTTTPSAWAGTSALSAGASRIRTAVGLHPQLAHERKGELALFDELLPETRYVGEVGLDGAPEFQKYWTDQQAVFTHVLDSCRSAGGRILSVHSRRAATAVLDAIEKAPGAGVPILHWFSGTTRELARAIDMGCWFSVGPAMLSNDKGKKLASAMPRARILTESDGPFAQLGDQPAFPWDVESAVRSLSNLWGEPLDSVQCALSDNLRCLADALPFP